MGKQQIHYVERLQWCLVSNDSIWSLVYVKGLFKAEGKAMNKNVLS